MKGFNSSRVALVMSATALFVALGGTAMAVSQIGTSQLQNGAVTQTKLHNGAVTSAKLAKSAVTNAKLANKAVGRGKLAAGAVGTGQLGSSAVATGNIAGGAVSTGKLASGAVTTTALADNAVTSTKVLDGSLTAADVAPNTFLTAGGTAANSQRLGNIPASGFVGGTGRLVSGRVVVPVGQTATLLELNFAHIDGLCESGVIPVQHLVAELPLENAFYSAINSGNSTNVNTDNALTPGNFLEATHSTTSPQSVTWQAAYNDGSDQLATAWATGQDEAGTCVFTGQGITSLG